LKCCLKIPTKETSFNVSQDRQILCVVLANKVKVAQMGLRVNRGLMENQPLKKLRTGHLAQTLNYMTSFFLFLHNVHAVLIRDLRELLDQLDPMAHQAQQETQEPMATQESQDLQGQLAHQAKVECLAPKDHQDHKES
jgi:hypothetical protein